MPKVSYVDVDAADKSGPEPIKEEIIPKSEPLPIPVRNKIITDEEPLEDYSDIPSDEDLELPPAPKPSRLINMKTRTRNTRHVRPKKKGMSITELAFVGAALAAGIYLLQG